MQAFFNKYFDKFGDTLPVKMIYSEVKKAVEAAEDGNTDAVCDSLANAWEMIEDYFQVTGKLDQYGGQIETPQQPKNEPYKGLRNRSIGFAPSRRR